MEVPKLAVSTIVISEQTFSVLRPPAGQLALSLQAFPVEAAIPGGKEIRFPCCALSELLTQIIHEHNKMVVMKFGMVCYVAAVTRKESFCIFFSAL